MGQHREKGCPLGLWIRSMCGLPTWSPHVRSLSVSLVNHLASSGPPFPSCEVKMFGWVTLRSFSLSVLMKNRIFFKIRAMESSGVEEPAAGRKKRGGFESYLWEKLLRKLVFTREEIIAVQLILSKKKDISQGYKSNYLKRWFCVLLLPSGSWGCILVSSSELPVFWTCCCSLGDGMEPPPSCRACFREWAIHISFLEAWSKVSKGFTLQSILKRCTRLKLENQSSRK